MSKEHNSFSLIKEAVKQDIKEGNSLWDFRSSVRAAIREAIIDGYMFYDYLQWRDKIEVEYEMIHDDDEREDDLIKAMILDKSVYLEDIGGDSEGLMKKLGLEPQPRHPDLELEAELESDFDIALEIEKGIERT